MESEDALPPPPAAAAAAAAADASAPSSSRPALPPQENLLANAGVEVVSPLVPIPRRGFGTVGEKGHIYVNFFPIQFTPPEEPVIQYQVSFFPIKCTPSEKPVIQYQVSALPQATSSHHIHSS